MSAPQKPFRVDQRSSARDKKNMYQNKWLLCTCIFLSAGGVCLVFMWPLLFDCVLSLQCNPVLYYLWKNVPFELKAEFYFFNWTNPEDVQNTSVKPRFEEVGPYVFYQKEEKCNIVWNDNGTVTFQLRRFWYHDEHSNLQDTITNIEPALLSISYITRSWNYFVRKGVFLTLSGYFSSIHGSHTVGELLHDGYPQPLMKIASAMPMFSALKLPPWDRFGWMYTRNGSTEFDGVYNMGTGSGTDLGKVYSWNYNSNPGYFEGTCGKVSGTSGQFFGRNLPEDRIEVFSTDLKRTIALKYLDKKTVNGILGNRYVAENYMMDNGTFDPNTKCFCTGECTPSGLVNISLTRHHSPIFASLPHFYGADPYYLNLVDGLEPDKDKHEFYFIIEPTSGMILEANAKIQLNLLMERVSGTGFFDGVSRSYFPALWIQQKVVIPGTVLFMVKILLALPAICITVGIMMMLLPALVVCNEIMKYRRRTKNQPAHEMETKVFLCDGSDK